MVNNPANSDCEDEGPFARWSETETDLPTATEANAATQDNDQGARQLTPPPWVRTGQQRKAVQKVKDHFREHLAIILGDIQTTIGDSSGGVNNKRRTSSEAATSSVRLFQWPSVHITVRPTAHNASGTTTSRPSHKPEVKPKINSASGFETI